jgi:hypothetical protein
MATKRATRHDALTSYVLDAAQQLGLTDWNITVSDEPASDDAYADTEAHQQSTNATIRFGHRFWKLNPDEKRVTIVHELLHLDTWRISNMVERLEEQIGRVSWAMFEPLWEDEWERTIDRNATRIAGQFPKVTFE